MNDTNGKRIRFLDVARGIGILLMILHHCIARSGTYNVMIDQVAGLILSFHMPLFFFLSGYVNHDQDTQAYFAGRVAGLLLPVLAFQAINTVISNFLLDMNYANPLGTLFSGFWFVYSVLYASCWFHLVNHFLVKKVPSCVWLGHIGTTIGMLLFAYGCSRLASRTENTFATAAMGYVFYSVGALSKKLVDRCSMLLNISSKGRIIYATIGILMVGILWTTSRDNQHVLMYISSYGNWKLFLFNAFVGIAAVYFLSVAIDNCAWIEFFGRNSLIIMITHFPVYSFVMISLQKYLRDEVILIGATFLLTAIITVPIACITDRYLPLLTGKYLKR